MVIGFNPNSYTVAESDGDFNLEITFLTGSFGLAPISVLLSLATTDGTALGERELRRFSLGNNNSLNYW